MRLRPDVSTLYGSRPAALPAFRSALIVTLFSGLMTPVFALPQKKNCDDMVMGADMSKADMINMRIDCRTENVNCQLNTLVDLHCQMHSCTPAQRSRLDNACLRSENARIRSRDAKGFRGLGRKVESKCFLLEYDGLVCNGGPNRDEPCADDPMRCGGNFSCVAPERNNGDGMCTNRRGRCVDGLCVGGQDSGDSCTNPSMCGGAKELCAEVMGDGIGDDDGVCEQTGNMKEVCVEICESPLSDEDDDNFDDGIAMDYQTGLEDLESVLLEANNGLAMALAARAEARQLRVAGVVAGDVCLQTYPWVTVVRFALVEAKDVAESAGDVCDATCGNTAAGFNCKVTCNAPNAAVFIVKTALNLAELADRVAERAGVALQYDCQGATSMTVDRIDARGMDTEMKIDQIKAAVIALDRKVVLLDGKVDDLGDRLSEVLELLRTPPGRRSGFPKP